jgi:hypothetical protein
MRRTPVKLTQSLADAICEQLADGKSLRTICSADGFPAVGSVCRWLAENETFREQYLRARDAQADALADEILDIADGAGAPVDAAEGANAVQRDRLRVETRKWVASKLKPKVYGDKADVNVTGQIDLRAFIQSLGEPD